ncbi:ABC transporter ATP-binding protein [Pararobbsia silviterrae]|uniref:ATP-binding cassette domain-containing protein n=1 Tax=Pararobbsia silviterrae TaxID=1792498 RepID=A0A494X627_9BURK|nr:ATP-binding cassette domain-containing protein [Pararobbsia silviterrae]RKP46137.1 ATP-binding cassette domain-containing protein [Pararobbsia silviterrae]
MAAISLRGISKAFGTQTPVLRNVDLEIGADEFCVFLGPSGCGKSTLLRIIAGLEDPSAGDIVIGGQRVNEVPPAERGIAMVFQSYALFPHMSVAENMGFGLKLARVSKAEIERRVLDAARVLQLEALLDRKPKALSGGQRQRVAIGRAIVREPGVFLFDEPLSNLDATLRGQTRVEIARVHRRFAGSSAVYVTHDQIEAMTLADKIVLLRSSRDGADLDSIAQVGAPLELYHSPANLFVAGFIGAPRMNFLTADVAQIESRGVRVRLTGTGESVTVPVDGARDVAPGDRVTLGVRPEHLTPLARGGEPGSQSGAQADAPILIRTVSLTERLGEQSYLHLSDDEHHPLLAKVQGDTTARVGDVVRLSVHTAHCHLFAKDGRALPRITHN